MTNLIHRPAPRGTSTPMHKLLFALATTTLSLTAFAQDERGVGYPSVAAALEALKTKKDVDISIQGGWTIANERPANTIWSFTPPDNPAHPAVVKRAVVSRDGTVSIHMTGLCQASKAACDKLMKDFEELNARMSESMNGNAAKRQLATSPEIDVKRTGSNAFQVVLKSYSSKTVEAGQQELLPTAKEVCGEQGFEFGKFQFETMEPVNSVASKGAYLLLRQDIACGAASRAQAPAATSPNTDTQWQPTAAQVESVERQSKAYFAAKDGRRYAEAYELLAPTLKQLTPFERWRSSAENTSSRVGYVLRRDIKKITWYRNPPQAAAGTYAAVDFSSQFTNANIHCGYLMWFEQADGSLRMMREEENYIDKATEQKMDQDAIERARAQFRCKR